MEFLATFHTHYGAICYDKHCKKTGIEAKMQPVPRSLSASCGTCVRFKAPLPPKVSDHEDMERCYIVGENGEYSPAEELEG